MGVFLLFVRRPGIFGLPKLDGFLGYKMGSVFNFEGSNPELFGEWQLTSAALRKFVEDADLEKEIQFEHQGMAYSIPSREMIQTVFNHGSYHRGQIMMMMRLLGILKISQTDYIEWVREKARG